MPNISMQRLDLGEIEVETRGEEANIERWGPAPFQFELIWLEEKQFFIF